MYFTAENFINEYTLNIFTDASIRRLKKDRSAGCYGAIAFIGNQKIDEDYRICTDSTNNDSEIKAIRSGVGLAIKWRQKARVINLFSDSQISIFGIRERIFNWRLVNNQLVGYGNSTIKNQSIYIEIMNMIVNNQIVINFYHQKGHVNVNNYDNLNNALHVFCASNGVRETVDIAFIKYITDSNIKVDKVSRKHLYEIENLDQYKLCDVFEYMPFNYKHVLNEYNKLQGGNYYVDN